VRANDIPFLIVNQPQDLRKGFLTRATIEFVMGVAPRLLPNGGKKILVPDQDQVILIPRNPMIALVAGARYVPNRQLLSIPFRSELIHRVA
jgi:hypothetical protein